MILRQNNTQYFEDVGEEILEWVQITSIILKRNGKIDILYTILGIFPAEIKVPVIIQLYTWLFSRIFIVLLSRGLERGWSSFKSKIIE